MIKKIILFLCLNFLGLIQYFSFSYQVDIPNPTPNIQSEWTIIASNSNNSYIFSLAKILTTYIWLFTGVVAFAVVLYAWFLLTTAQWNQDDLKKANKMLVWGLVWIFVSLLSYLIIKVLVGLF